MNGFWCIYCTASGADGQGGICNGHATKLAMPVLITKSGYFSRKNEKPLASARGLCYNFCCAWIGEGYMGALAQLVERTTSCASPAPTPQVGELEQKINTKFGALAQLVARYIRIVEVTGSNPVCSTTNPAFRCRIFCFIPLFLQALWMFDAISIDLPKFAPN